MASIRKKNPAVEKASYLKHRESRLKRQREYYQENRANKLARCALHESKPEVKERRNAAYRVRMANSEDKRKHKSATYKAWSVTENGRASARARNLRKAARPECKLKSSIHRRLRRLLKNSKLKLASWTTIFGYTPIELRLHIESLLTDGMTWDNYGLWHLDHVIPVSWFQFDSISDPECMLCWSKENLRPLWGKENLIKRNFYAIINGTKYTRDEWVLAGKPFHVTTEDIPGSMVRQGCRHYE